jgi:peptidoglycan/xylan/chitin deacetylase (PgdA/CDA1 family)
MDKPLIKLYLFIGAATVLLVLLVPVALGHTSSWVEDAWTHVQLATSDHVMSVAQPTEPKGHVVFVMDDGWETQYTAARPLFDKYGYTACIAVIPAAVGTENYMSYRQLADLYLDGWDMLNHTNNHLNLAELPEQTQAEQMARGRAWLNEHGLKRGSDILVYPGGAFNQATLDAMQREGFAAGRSLKSLWLTAQDCALEDAEVCNLISGMPLDIVKAAADKAMNNGSAVIFMLHKVEPVSDDTHMQIEEAFLEQILSYIADNADKLDVVTMTQLLSVRQPPNV